LQLFLNRPGPGRNTLDNEASEKAFKDSFYGFPSVTGTGKSNRNGPKSFT
jgi:hypothetical protein